MRDTYALIEEEVPGGRMIAPFLLVLLCLAFVAWAVPYIYERLFAPIVTLAQRLVA